MEPGFFIDKGHEPEADEVKNVMGKSGKHWDALFAFFTENFGPIEPLWRFSGKKHGWTLKFEGKKRALAYMTPCDGYFRVSFALSEKAEDAALAAGLPDDLVEQLETGRRYSEGKPLRIEVKTAKDAKIAMKVAELKSKY